ncbi:glycosyltransferase [Rhizobium halophytocola]|uniref:Glycosyltransferase involved in cell wall biosynthesis n=1 Tax=Rhizobium halophytocola TaxID=735519 RepID=A0ABS4DY87_9HYPH|nr:glycosyltransferase [Rhizobium halophytocola]MBP1850659.1 glycosyltransferase involved in cell wall biosynthesis [Rhizobium halophytocola]
MKILQVLAGGKFGGAETAFVDMAIALHEAGQTVEVATRANDIRVPRLRAAGVPVHTLPFGGGFDFYTRWKLKRIIRRFRPDIVQSWMSRASAAVPKWTPGMGIPRYQVVSRLGGYYKLKYFRAADHYLAITPDIARYIVAGGINAGRVHFIANFAETEPVEQPVDRSQLAVPEGAPLLLAMGRLHDAKGFDTLIETVAAMPGVHLRIAGEGPDRASLEGLIARLAADGGAAADAQARIKLLGWRTDRAALLQASDIFVMSSRKEPFGTIFVQAWAENTPLIATRAEGPSQFVQDGEDGLLVDIDDKAEMRAAIQRLIDDPALARQLSAAGYQRYLQEFTKQACVEAHLAFYNAIRVGVSADPA